jgi:hypothetical protein
MLLGSCGLTSALRTALAAVHNGGRRMVFGIGIPPRLTFSTTFLHKLGRRGRPRVKLVVSDAHAGVRRLSPRWWARLGNHAVCNSCATCLPCRQEPPPQGLRVSSPPPCQDDAETAAQWAKGGRQTPSKAADAHSLDDQTEADVLACMATPAGATPRSLGRRGVSSPTHQTAGERKALPATAPS